MSDDEGTKKQTGYRLEYASSGRAKCSGPKPCAGTPIAKGELRMGTLLDYQGNKSFKWRHWGCTTSRILSNFKNQFDEADELDGFDELKDEDKEKVRTAWAEGHVADEDIPDSARKDDEDDSKTKKKTTAKRKKDADDGGEPEEKPKKKRAPAKPKASVDLPLVPQNRSGRMGWSFLVQSVTPALLGFFIVPGILPSFGILLCDLTKLGSAEAVRSSHVVVADEADTDAEKPKRKRGPAKKQTDVEEDEVKEDETEEKPKRKRAPPKKASGGDDSTTKGKPAKKAAPKRGKAKAKPDDDQSGEEIALPNDEELSGSDEEQDAAPAKSVKGKKASTSKAKKVSDDNSDEEDPRPKSTTKPKAKASDKPKPASKGKGKGKDKKAATDDESGEAIDLPKDEELSGTEGEDEEKVPPKQTAKPKKGTSKKQATSEAEGEEADEASPVSKAKSAASKTKPSSKKGGKSKVAEEPTDELEEPEVVPASKAKKAREVAKAAAAEGQTASASKSHKAKTKEAVDTEPEPEAETAEAPTKKGARTSSRGKKAAPEAASDIEEAAQVDAKPKKAPASKTRGKKVASSEVPTDDKMEVDAENTGVEASASSKRKPASRAKPASKAKGAKAGNSKAAQSAEQPSIEENDEDE